MSTSKLPEPLSYLQPLSRVGQDLRLSNITLWRFRKRGWLKTVNIAGRNYVTAEELARFLVRARSGEFAKGSTFGKAPEELR